MGSGELSVVTVVFESELLLLRLQARSAARFLTGDLLDQILVIDNTARGVSARYRAELLSDYGNLAERVRILRPAQICDVPGTVGWRSQQVLKMAVSSHLTADRYVILDAKNHFVATPKLDFFQAPDGRARVNVYSYRSHPLRPQFITVMNYLGLDPAEHLDRFTATITPFVLDTSTVKSMMADIERRSGRTFAEEFVANGLLEFILYSGWIIASGRGLERTFDFHQVVCPVVWPRGANLSNVTELVRQSDVAGTPLFSLHRKALAALDAESVTVIADFWVRRGLFDSAAAATTFVGDFRRSYRRQELRRKIREIPHRAGAILARRRGLLPAGRSKDATPDVHPLPGEAKP